MKNGYVIFQDYLKYTYITLLYADVSHIIETNIQDLKILFRDRFKYTNKKAKTKSDSQNEYIMGLQL